jgi:outer membrane lipoprotein-sorting protein
MDEGRPVNILRRLPLSRLLLLCALVVVIGVSATALASALGGGPTPPAKPLAQSVHDALAGAPVEGVSANITLTNRLIEGANLAGGGTQAGELASSPLLSGGSGRLWISKDGRMRLELQAEKGDTQIIYDGHTLTAYDAASNTLYRYTPKDESSSTTAPGDTQANQHEVPSVAKIEEAISHLQRHANVSGASPTNIAGQPAYTVRLSPQEGGSLIGGLELSFDANNGAPLRAAVYSSTSSSPVIELAATDVTYGPVDSSVFSISPPSSAKVQDLSAPSSSTSQPNGGDTSSKPTVTLHGHGITGVAVVQAQAKAGESSGLEDLPKVQINGTSASELKTELGTILTFERAGTRYVVAGALDPAAVEAIARGL